MTTDIDRLVRLLGEIGCTDVRFRLTKHYTLFFSYQGQHAKPIFISSTPSAQNALKKIGADILRELKLLGGTPHQSNQLKIGMGTVFALAGSPFRNPLRLLRAYFYDARVARAWHELAKLAGQAEPSAASKDIGKQDLDTVDR